MTELINFNNEVSKRNIIVAVCPQCESQDWNVHVDKLDVWDNLKGFECSQCGFFIYFEKIPVIEVE